MSEFTEALKKKIVESRSNNFGIENYDELRFGKYVAPQDPPATIVVTAKKWIKKITGYKKNSVGHYQIAGFSKYEKGLQRIYNQLDSNGKDLMVDLIAYRTMGYRRIKLKRNNHELKRAIDQGNSLANPEDTYDPHFRHFILEKLDLNPIGCDIKLYFSGAGIATDFIIEQYAYKSNGVTIVEAESGDVVIDAGACWGDTALYFAHKVGTSGKVYSFEFIPNNIKLFNINKSFNPHLATQIELVQHPVSNKVGDEIYFKDDGPGSRIELQPFDGQTGSTTTITIDAFVKEKNISRVDFIKMDIEGAEPSALEGAIETIKKFRPKLAIAIYHSMDDFTSIPNWILDLNLDYEIFLDHFTIHAEETICFAKPRK